LGVTWNISGVDGTLYTVVTDVMTTYAAVITGAVTDEVFGSFDAPDFEVIPERPDLETKTTRQGLYALTAYPSKSLPQLATTPYTIKYTLKAPGFRDYPLQVTIPAGAILPVSAPAATLRRLPVRLQGRVVSDATGLAVSGAVIVTVDNPNPPSPLPPPPIPHSMMLRNPLYAAHPINATVQGVTLAQVGTAQLVQPAAGGTTTLVLNNTTGLGGSTFLQIKTPGNVLVEYAVVKSVGPAPGAVTLATPLTRSYATGPATVINFVNATTTGSVAHLLTDANDGDGIVVADALLTATTVVVDDGTPTAEYHELGAVTDSNGYYGVNGIGRVQELFLQANGATPVSWMIEFDQAVNVVDFRI
jgi:hypothetical protein